MKKYIRNFNDEKNDNVLTSDEGSEMLLFDAEDMSDFDVIEAKNIVNGTCSCGCGGAGAGMGA